MTSQNGGKPRKKGRSNKYDERQKRAATPEQKEAQLCWRTDQLFNRAVEGRLTDKNLLEANQLGLPLEMEYIPIGLMPEVK